MIVGCPERNAFSGRHRAESLAFPVAVGNDDSRQATQQQTTLCPDRKREGSAAKPKPENEKFDMRRMDKKESEQHVAKLFCEDRGVEWHIVLSNRECPDFVFIKRQETDW